MTQTSLFLPSTLYGIYCLPQVTVLNHYYVSVLVKRKRRKLTLLHSYLRYLSHLVTPSLTKSSNLGMVLRWQYWKMGGISFPSLQGRLQNWLRFVSSNPFPSALAQPSKNYSSWGLTPAQSGPAGLERNAWGRSCQKQSHLALGQPAGCGAEGLSCLPRPALSPWAPFSQLSRLR